MDSLLIYGMWVDREVFVPIGGIYSTLPLLIDRILYRVLLIRWLNRLNGLILCRNYFEQTDALVWVVDSGDTTRLNMCK